jgi:hypothetical protein
MDVILFFRHPDRGCVCKLNLLSRKEAYDEFVGEDSVYLDEFEKDAIDEGDIKMIKYYAEEKQKNMKLKEICLGGSREDIQKCLGYEIITIIGIFRLTHDHNYIITHTTDDPIPPYHLLINMNPDTFIKKCMMEKYVPDSDGETSDDYVEHKLKNEIYEIPEKITYDYEYLYYCFKSEYISFDNDGYVRIIDCSNDYPDWDSEFENRFYLSQSSNCVYVLPLEETKKRLHISSIDA